MFGADMHGHTYGLVLRVRAMTTFFTAILRSRRFLNQSVFRTGTERCWTKRSLRKLSLTTRFVLALSSEFRSCVRC